MNIQSSQIIIIKHIKHGKHLRAYRSKGLTEEEEKANISNISRQLSISHESRAIIQEYRGKCSYRQKRKRGCARVFKISSLNQQHKSKYEYQVFQSLHHYCCTLKFSLPFPQHFLTTRPLELKIQLGFPLLKTCPCTVDSN